LEDVVEMLHFVPPLAEKKKRKDRDEGVPDEDVEKEVCFVFQYLT